MESVPAGLGIEVYMTPNPTSGKAASAQVDEVVSALVNGGINVRTIWIQVFCFFGLTAKLRNGTLSENFVKHTVVEWKGTDELNACY